MKKILQIFGIVFLIIIVLVIVVIFVFKQAYKEYEVAETYCIKNSKSEVMKIYNDAPKDKNGAANINNISFQDFEKQTENFYHKCMNEKGVPDSFLEFKSPYLFD